MTQLETFLRIIQESLRLNKTIDYNINRLSELVQSAQIAMLQTVLAEFILIENNKMNKQDDTQTSNDILNLIKITVRLLKLFILAKKRQYLVT